MRSSALDRMLQRLKRSGQSHNGIIAIAKNDIPAKSSSFSLPNKLVNMATSPEPLIPSFPFRKTKARSVDGFVPPCLRRLVGPSCQTSPGTVGMVAEDCVRPGAIDGRARRRGRVRSSEFVLVV